MSPAPPIPQELWDTIPPAVRAALLAAFTASHQRIEALEAEVRELKARLDRNSSNSSKPPSTEPLHLKRQPPRPPSKRRPGGQSGHRRHLRQLVPPERLADAIDCKPRICPGCGEALRGDDPTPIRHQVAELPPIRPEVIEYRRHRLTCRRCGRAARGPLPAGVPRGAVGPRLQAWVGLLSGAYRLSKRQVRRLFADLLGVSISTGSVAKLQRQAASVLTGPAAEIREAVRQAEAVHVDETGWRQGGKKAWLWVGVAADATAFVVHRSRGRDALETLLGAEPGRDRVVISDRFPTYGSLPSRQVCWAHLRRDFQAMVDRESGGEVVGRHLLNAARWVFTWWARWQSGTLGRATLRAYVAGLRGQVRHALGQGTSCACAWTAKVCRMILEVEPHLWTFAVAEGVAPDNNAAERALRHGVIWRKQSLGTASEAGSRFVERMLSVVETCRQRGRDVAAYLTECFEAATQGHTIPSPLT